MEAEELICEVVVVGTSAAKPAAEILVAKTANLFAIAVCSVLAFLCACKLPASKLSNARILENGNGTIVGLNNQPISCCGQGLCVQGACLVGGCVVLPTVNMLCR